MENIKTELKYLRKELKEAREYYKILLKEGNEFEESIKKEYIEKLGEDAYTMYYDLPMGMATGEWVEIFDEDVIEDEDKKRIEEKYNPLYELSGKIQKMLAREKELKAELKKLKDEEKGITAEEREEYTLLKRYISEKRSIENRYTKDLEEVNNKIMKMLNKLGEETLNKLGYKE